MHLVNGTRYAILFEQVVHYHRWEFEAEALTSSLLCVVAIVFADGRMHGASQQCQTPRIMELRSHDECARPNSSRPERPQSIRDILTVVRESAHCGRQGRL